MPDIGWQELFFIAVLGIIVIGPKDLPKALRTIMGIIKKAKGLAGEFQKGIDDVVREAELSDLRKQVEGAASKDISKSISDYVDPDGGLTKDINDDMNALRDEMKAQSDAALKDRIASGANKVTAGDFVDDMPDVPRPPIVDDEPEEATAAPASAADKSAAPEKQS